MDSSTLYSLVLLTFFIGILLSWLVKKTLKEGRGALEEMKKDTK